MFEKEKVHVQTESNVVFEKDSVKHSLRKYIAAVLALSLSTLLLYFYYNSFAPVLSLMAKDFHFSHEERYYV